MALLPSFYGPGATRACHATATVHTTPNGQEALCATAVPEPGSPASIAVSAALGLIGIRRRRGRWGLWKSKLKA